MLIKQASVDPVQCEECHGSREYSDCNVEITFNFQEREIRKTSKIKICFKEKHSRYQSVTQHTYIFPSQQVYLIENSEHKIKIETFTAKLFLS